jgi:hypothetical protein
VSSGANSLSSEADTRRQDHNRYFVTLRIR